ncbi:hypothetical protein ACT2FY_00335 [Paraburkholderia fungorum]|uniref:hypothetical protein n=1 Tax=Paraburkholderia fungorum TaxID=134537 RepID=UPI00402BE4B8
MDGFIVKARIGETYLKCDGSDFVWDSSKHAFVVAHVFEYEGEANAVAAQFDGRVLFQN